jgi:hypothetical protein
MDEKVKTLAIMLGVAVMHDIRMIIREELARVGLKEEE